MVAADLFSVAGQIVLVTGAARGLGYAMAEVMAENGATVVLTDIDPTALQDAGAKLRQRGLKVETEVLDVTNTERLKTVIDATAEKYGKLDVVFSNAGMSAGPGPWSPVGEIGNVSLGAWQQVLQMNLTSAFVAIQTAAAHMKRQRSGRIVVTSSIACFRAEPLVGYAYVASKAAISNVVRQAACELAAYNVLVNAIAPGPFMTSLGNGRLQDQKTADAFANAVPLRRIADTKEMKGLALLLGSPASSFITGATLTANGGQYMA